ncbi:unnamed protein product [Rotaria magnacalcarata]|uniref:Uncharacterized protein n=6 Tax=Rotaria magnacalcarata TaxID=392030 RepID=A0A815K9H4_9BILA|nr:unnamed protein product [Rotaria magnacalcarata]CAF1927748.1 unnamed protein product [Rotaria magnacalcarata]CAF2085772.1 unnamed protein product [Rotaria magnacalcarata]CAF2094613.1 unnamed protein product [Rotaria magnacalcarata]CAF3734948.1 unnamed protein product [Rotaria magnacalcarata]
MWYPPQQHWQPPPSWHGYVNNFSSQQQQLQQRTYSRTTYYCNTDESPITNRANTQVIPRNNKNEPFVQFNPIHTDDVNAAGIDYHNTNSTGSYSDEMSSPSYQTPNNNPHWNPVITPSTKTLITPQENPSPPIPITSSPSSPSRSGCWDWLLYSPEFYSHLYIPSSSFVQQQKQDDDLDLLARLPTWLLVLLYPSTKQCHARDDENDSDQEISSLNNYHDEALLSMNIDKSINKVSSNLSLSSENTPTNSQKVSQNRSSTPDTDDGYQSASDASRSDCSQQSSLQYDHHNSKDDITMNTSSSFVPKRISYAAAVKPMATSINNNNKTSPLSTPIIKTKNSSSLLAINDVLNNNNGQKLKFVAPRFERMHHAKQYSSSATTNKDSPSSSLTSRSQIRSNINNNNQRNHINNSAKRR